MERQSFIKLLRFLVGDSDSATVKDEVLQLIEITGSSTSEKVAANGFGWSKLKQAGVEQLTEQGAKSLRHISDGNSEVQGY